MTRLMLIIGGVLVLVTAGLWLLFDHVIAAWLPVLANFLRGLTMRSVAAFLGGFARRLLLVDLPKRLLTGYAFIFFVSPRARARFRRTMRRYRQAVWKWWERQKERHAWIFGRRSTMIVAAAASIAVFGAFAVVLGWYVVVWVGSTELLRFGWRAVSYAFASVRHTMLRSAAFLHLDRTAARVGLILPERYRTAARSARGRAVRNAIRLRKAAAARLTARAAALRRRFGQPAGELASPSAGEVGGRPQMR